jgi:hypothetical protein
MWTGGMRFESQFTTSEMGIEREDGQEVLSLYRRIKAHKCQRPVLVRRPGQWEEKTKRPVLYLTTEFMHRRNLGGGQGIGMPLHYFYT